MIVDGYDLHVYCYYTDCVESRYTKGHFERLRAEFPGTSKRDSYAQARRAGWHFVTLPDTGPDCVCNCCWKRGRRGKPAESRAVGLRQ